MFSLQTNLMVGLMMLVYVWAKRNIKASHTTPYLEAVWTHNHRIISEHQHSTFYSYSSLCITLAMSAWCTVHVCESDVQVNPTEMTNRYTFTFKWILVWCSSEFQTKRSCKYTVGQLIIHFLPVNSTPPPQKRRPWKSASPTFAHACTQPYTVNDELPDISLQQEWGWGRPAGGPCVDSQKSVTQGQSF